MNRAVALKPSAFERLTLRALLWVYPRAFRSEFEADLLATYSAARRDCATSRLRFQLWRRTVVSLIRHGVAQRIQSNQPKESRMSTCVRILASMPRDFRSGLRLLATQPGFTVLAVLILSLGIGANTAVFGIMNTLLLKPRPGVSDQLVGVYSRDRTRPTVYSGFSYPEYSDLRGHTELFASLSAHVIMLGGVTEGDVTRRTFIDLVTHDYFDTFGVPLALGRTFTAEESRPGADVPVAVIAYSAWQRMGSDVVLGQRVRINQRDFTIVGVAAKGFGGQTVLFSPEVWLPMGVYGTLTDSLATRDSTATLTDRRHRNLMLIARFQPGVTIASAAPALTGIAGQMERAYPADSEHQEFVAAPLSRLGLSTKPMPDTPIVTMTSVLLVMSTIVLFIASLNLANMLLARGGARRKEFAIRLALGGGRGRLLRQLLMESFVLSLAGGAGGLFLGWSALRILTTSLASSMPLPVSLDTALDARMFLATLGFCLLSTAFFGLGPAWKLAKTDALPELKDYAGELPGGRRGRFGLAARDVLVMGQLALSLLLLTAAGLFVRQAFVSARSDPGFSLDAGIVANVDSSLAGYDDARGRALYRDALAAVRRQPGVRTASFATLMPFGEFDMSKAVQLPGAPIRRGDPGADDTLIASTVAGISEDYFQSLGLGIQRGRDFLPTEAFAAEGPQVAIIDGVLARALFGADDPVGRQIQVPNDIEGAAPILYDVVGIAPPIRHWLFSQTPEPHLYLPIGREFMSNAYLHIATGSGTAAAEAAMLPDIRRALAGVDERLPILTLETRPMFRSRNLFLAILNAGAGMFATFGVVALIMAMLGVYGVKAYIVSRRTREIGIRVALGAQQGDVIWMVVRAGIVLSAVGLGVGVVLSVAAAAALASVQPQSGGQNGLVIAVALMTLVASALAASWLPARRATRIAPVRALRAE